jgi:AbrB family looped-hinge helix DNA binding protein
MPKKKSVDKKKLIKMIKDETPQPEIMKNFGFKTSTQLKNAYMNALIDEGTVPAIQSGRKTSKKAPKKEVNVGKRGSIIIPKGIVAELGFAENDVFAVRKTKAGISLKKL